MDPIMAELLTQLVKNGTLNREDIIEMAGRLDHNDYEDEAHDVRVSLIEALVDPVEDLAARRRAEIRIVPDGGKSVE